MNLLAWILEPQPGEAAHDPACGSGGMLVVTINQLREAGRDHRMHRLHGQEINLPTSSIARMNPFLKIEDFEIKRGDTLRASAFEDTGGAVRLVFRERKPAERARGVLFGGGSARLEKGRNQKDVRAGHRGADPGLPHG